MNEEEILAQLAALEARNASLKEQKALHDRIAKLEAENAALDSEIADDADAAVVGEDAAVVGEDAALDAEIADAADVTAAGEDAAVVGEDAATATEDAAAVAEDAVLDAEIVDDEDVTAATEDAAAVGEDVTAVAVGGAAAAQTAVTQAVLVAPAAVAAEPALEVALVRKRGRLRNILVGVLVVLSCLAVVFTGVAWWAHYTVMSSDGYIKLVGPVGKDPQAIRSLSNYVAAEVVTATDLQQRTATALATLGPDQVQFLAGPITSAVTKFIADGTDKVLSTPQAYDLWIKINRIAHDQIVALLRGQTTYTYIQGDDVKLDTLPLISQVLVWISGKLPGALGSKFSPPVIAPGTPPAEAIQQVSAWTGRNLPADFGQVTLLKNSSLGAAKQAVRVFDSVVIVLPIVVALLVALAIWLSRHRRRTLIELGIGAAVALILTRVIVKQGSAALVADIPTSGGLTVVRNVVNASIGPLTTLTIWTVVVGVVVAVTAWIVGRRDLQVAVIAAGKRVVQAQDEAFAAHSPFIDWLERYAQWLRIAGLVAGLILLLVATSSWLGLLLWVIVIVLYEGVISLLIRQWPFARREKGDDATA